MSQNALCETLNIGTGKSVTIDNLLSYLCSIMDVKPKIIKSKLPFGDPEKSSGIYTKLNDILKINTNEFRTLKEGLKDTIKLI